MYHDEEHNMNQDNQQMEKGIRVSDFLDSVMDYIVEKVKKEISSDIAEPIELVQIADQEGMNPTVALAATPTFGNLMVLTAMQRSNTSHENITVPAGWTKRVGHDVLLSDSSPRRSLAVWTRVVEVGDTGSVQVSCATEANAVLAEYSTGLNFLEAVVNDNGSTDDATELSIGNTSELAAGSYFLVGVGGAKQNATPPYSEFSFDTFDQDGTFGVNSVVGYGHEQQTLTSPAALNVTASYTGGDSANRGLIAALLVFSS